ncbi:MAG TPA: ubiquinol-cytochrome c reductase iron-sulfur subunit [Alphaproteobacteria bacterium]|nr:ubiquinol-cytochrome c reductase iron-sulfur subunit [Alphaproteobacteria bacterium]
MVAGAASEPTRRDFLYIATGAIAAVGAASTVWPLIDQMNPSADVLALSSIKVDLSPVAEGQQITVMWRSKPVFIRHRTGKEIQEAESANWKAMRDPQSDDSRIVAFNGALQKQWLVLIGICTHLGCIPLKTDKGYLCPCHGSQYDTSGRIVAGPAPLDLEVPPYKYLTATQIQIG